MYRVAFVLFQNMNTKRIEFYTRIFDFIKKNNTNFLYDEDFLRIGKESGFTEKQTKDEIIGCLYAPFFVKPFYDGTKYFITENARLKFADLTTECHNELLEIGLTIKLEDKINRLLMHLTDTLESELVGNLLNRGWTRNKSKYRLMKKHSSMNVILEEVTYLIEHINGVTENKTTYQDLLKHYGRPWQQMRCYTGNLKGKGFYESKLLPQYPDLFKEILEYCVQPIDWQGNAMSLEILKRLIAKYVGGDADAFFTECIYDGLIRHCSINEVTLTSSGYTLIRTYLNKAQQVKALQIFIRKLENDQYLLMIGENSEFPSYIKEYLTQYLHYNQRGWYELAISKDGLLKSLSELLRRYQSKGGEQCTLFGTV